MITTIFENIVICLLENEHFWNASNEIRPVTRMKSSALVLKNRKYEITFQAEFGVVDELSQFRRFIHGTSVYLWYDYSSAWSQDFMNVSDILSLNTTISQGNENFKILLKNTKIISVFQTNILQNKIRFSWMLRKFIKKMRFPKEMRRYIKKKCVVYQNLPFE